jgi:hypothetical protein
MRLQRGEGTDSDIDRSSTIHERSDPMSGFRGLGLAALLAGRHGRLQRREGLCRRRGWGIQGRSPSEIKRDKSNPNCVR